MTYTLTVSSQGQVVIPSNVRKLWGIKSGHKLILDINRQHPRAVGTISPQPVSWVDRVKGIAKGAYGDVDKYIEHERASWDKDKSWP
ncbi:MAG: AbrB/MazE/SpoVT family DNA-binding domain-containing protein [Patescibacteria group bacterium]